MFYKEQRYTHPVVRRKHDINISLKKKTNPKLLRGKGCIFRAVTDRKGSSKCIPIKLDRSKHTYIQHSRGSIGKDAGLVPMLQKKSPSSVIVYGCGGGGVGWGRGGLGQVLFFTLCAVKGFLWFGVLMRKDEGHPDMSRKKNSTEKNRPTHQCGAWKRVYIQFLQRENKRMYSHLYIGASLSVWRKRHLLVYHQLDYWPQCTPGECTQTYIQYCREQQLKGRLRG